MVGVIMDLASGNEVDPRQVYGEIGVSSTGCSDTLVLRIHFRLVDAASCGYK